MILTLGTSSEHTNCYYDVMSCPPSTGLGLFPGLARTAGSDKLGGTEARGSLCQELWYLFVCLRSTVLPEMDAVNYTCSSPVGVAGLICPWNLPLYLLTFKIAPAIAAGCTVVCKPSEMTSLTAYLLAKVMNEAGLWKMDCKLNPRLCINSQWLPKNCVPILQGLFLSKRKPT